MKRHRLIYAVNSKKNKSNLSENSLTSINVSDFDINKMIRYADLYVGVDCVNSNGYNPEYESFEIYRERTTT